MAIAHQAALRVLPLATVVGAVSNGRALSLAMFRASLASGVAAVRQIPNIRHAARKAAAAANAGAFAAYAANAAALNAVDIAADAAAFGDTKIPQSDLMAGAICLPQDLHNDICPVQTDPRNALQTGGSWAFWADWYAHALAGDPLPWTLQEAVALLPNEIWHAGPEAVAVAIEEVAHGLK